MLFFGYIVSEVRYKDLQEDIVKVVDNLGECTIKLPRLIIGLEEAKKYARQNNWEFDILDRIYPNGDMWTFKKTEKREFYEEDIETFKKRIVEHQGSDVTYHYINTYNLRYSKIKRLYDICLNDGLNKKLNYMIVGRGIIYVPMDGNNILGISIPHLQYVGIEREKVIDKLRKSPYNRVYFTSSRNMKGFTRWFKDREYVIASVFEKHAKKRI